MGMLMELKFKRLCHASHLSGYPRQVQLAPTLMEAPGLLAVDLFLGSLAVDFLHGPLAVDLLLWTEEMPPLPRKLPRRCPGSLRRIIAGWTH